MESTGISAITGAINTMISDTATAASGLITTNVPVIAPVVAGMVLVGFGIRLFKRFMK